MPDTILTRIRRAWNVFKFGPRYDRETIGSGSGYRPDRVRMLYSNERSIINSVYNRIGIDVAAVGIQHVRTDENGRYLDVISSGLNNCLTVEANIDQAGRALIQDIVMSMCDEGVVAIVPVDTLGENPILSSSYDILTMRTAKILQWYPEHVQVNLYNQATGLYEQITLPKTFVAIVENPLYAVMNEPNSTLRRLIEKINLLDVIDKQSGSGKLDIIVQLPYALKTEKRIEQAEKRRATLEAQLKDAQYGIGYVDSTEKIVQLNRPAENNLMAQIEYLTRMLWSQLGLTQAIFDGTADEVAILNYWSRTIEPILGAITDAMTRTFLTKTARSQGQKVLFFRDPFKLVPAETLADMADKFTRNEIVSSNEFRAVLAMKPSKDPKADELRNKNINQPDEQSAPKEKVIQPNKEGSLSKNAKSTV